MNVKKLLLLGGVALSVVCTAQTITGKYEIPKVPDWAKNAVFYQIVLRPVLPLCVVVRMADQYAGLPVSARDTPFQPVVTS